MASADLNPPDAELPPPDREQELQQVREALRNLRFGSVNSIVQDGVVVQIDRTERRRLRQPGGK
jgi:hypothetical protein